MTTRIQNHINGRLSLREPQAQSLAKLKQALDAAPEMLKHQRDVAAVLETLKAEFPTLQEFERDFPSLCFALATGVGKTRLMGAFIAYLHLAHGINNFFVLAPNLTIYNKLIGDFSPNTPKYVFKGIGEFAVNPPRVIKSIPRCAAARSRVSSGCAKYWATVISIIWLTCPIWCC